MVFAHHRIRAADLDDIEQLRGKWPDKVLHMQENWIGRSEGARIRFPLVQPIADVTEIEVFTTRPDTLFGATFMSIAAEHPLALRLCAGTSREAEVTAFEQGRPKTRPTRCRRLRQRGLLYRRVRDQSRKRSPIPVYIANFCADGLRHRRGHGGPCPRSARLRVRQKYAPPIEVVIQPDGRTALASELSAAYTEAGQLGPLREFSGQGQRRGGKRTSPRGLRKGQGRTDRFVPAARLAGVTPALLGLSDSDGRVPQHGYPARARCRAAGHADRH